MTAQKTEKKRKLFVHIGTHKTGTTSIQYALHGNERNLKKAGFIYPVTARHPLAHVQHDLLFLAIRGNHPDQNLFKVENLPVASELFSELRNEISDSGAGKVILSAENLSLLNRSEVQRIADYFDDFQIIPILFVRRFSEYVESVHLTRVRIDTDYAAMFRDRQDFWKSYREQSILDCISSWAAVASSGRVVLRNYDNREVDSVESFSKIVGIKPQSLVKSATRFNQSQSVLSEAIRTACCRHGISESLATGLAKQLSRVRFVERHSLIPEHGREELDTAYKLQINSALNSGLVDTDDEFDFSGQDWNGVTYIDGALSILFALGRAVAGDERLT